MNGPILGWDVGGANLKVARIGEDGHTEPRVLERPFALWREPHLLPAVLAEAADRLGARAQGAQVRQIARGVRQVMRRLGPACPRVAVLAGQGAFLARAAAEEVGLATHDMASHVGSAAARTAPAVAVAYLLVGTAEA